jgi:Protein of unknown function (DUF3096)
MQSSGGAGRSGGIAGCWSAFARSSPGASELKFDGLVIARTLADINRSLSMRCDDPPGRGGPSCFGTSPLQPKETHMMRTVAHLMPFAALAGGILVLLKPPLLNYVVALYLILVGSIGLNHMYHFIR